VNFVGTVSRGNDDLSYPEGIGQVEESQPPVLLAGATPETVVPAATRNALQHSGAERFWTADIAHSPGRFQSRR
jgi:hypothetical protein